jgi:hypothetical protein
LRHKLSSTPIPGIETLNPPKQYAGLQTPDYFRLPRKEVVSRRPELLRSARSVFAFALALIPILCVGAMQERLS